MKILIINQILYTHSDGVIPEVKTIKDTMIYQMCMGFRELGHEVTLAAASEYKPTIEEEYDFEVLWFDSVYTRLLPATLLPFSPQLKNYIKMNHPLYDLIISKEVFSISSLWASTICPKKTVLWVEQANHQRKFHKLPSKFWFNVVAKLFMNKVKAVVPCSEKAQIYLRNYLKKTTEDIVEHGIDINKFSPADNKKRQVVVSGQLIKRKNIESIIEIFSRFHALDGFSDVKLLIAGRGPEELNLKRLVETLQITDSVSFLGFLSQKDLNTYISESLAFLVNTRADMNMVSVPESVCSCTPIIMNEVPLSSWYVKKFNLGIVKQGWGEDDLKEVIQNSRKYVENCRQYRERLSLSCSAQLLIDIYKR